MKDSRCPCEGKTLDRLLRPAILALLAKEESHAYGVVLRLRELELFKSSRPDNAGVYKTLKTMVDAEQLSVKPEAKRKGTDKQVYAPTKAGRECLRRWRKTLVEYQQQIQDLIEFIPDSTKPSILKRRVRALNETPSPAKKSLGSGQSILRPVNRDKRGKSR